MTDHQDTTTGLTRMAQLLDRIAQLERERDDLEERLSGMLCDLTGGKMSKTGYDVRTMTQAVEEHFNEVEQSDRDEAWQAVVEARKERDEARSHLRSLAKWVDLPDDTPPLDIAVEVSAALQAYPYALRDRDEARADRAEAKLAKLEALFFSNRLYLAIAQTRLSTQDQDALHTRILDLIRDETGGTS